jgi:hypothetical protein
MSSKFKRKIEDFICENCGNEVKGDGFTNHCPKCLYSKHVDIFPGDRAETCGGMMEPVDTEESGGQWQVIQKCCRCGKIHKNKISTNDNFDHLIKISKNN